MRPGNSEKEPTSEYRFPTKTKIHTFLKPPSLAETSATGLKSPAQRLLPIITTLWEAKADTSLEVRSSRPTWRELRVGERTADQESEGSASSKP
ncbi:hypothetical protein AAY473_008239 [Plecturocebus cupreus]